MYIQWIYIYTTKIIYYVDVVSCSTRLDSMTVTMNCMCLCRLLRYRTQCGWLTLVLIMYECTYGHYIHYLRCVCALNGLYIVIVCSIEGLRCVPALVYSSRQSHMWYGLAFVECSCVCVVSMAYLNSFPCVWTILLSTTLCCGWTFCCCCICEYFGWL